MNALLRSQAARTAVRSATNASRLNAMGSRRGVLTLAETKYTAHAVASGQGRNGTVKSDDDAGLEHRLAMPQALGGKGDGANPEQLFAMGYAACFLSALQLVAGKRGMAEQAKNATIRSSVHIGKPEGQEGFALAVDMTVNGIDDQSLLDEAHKVCPYSRALEQGAVVNISLGGEPNPGPSNSQTGKGDTSKSASTESDANSSSSDGTSTQGPLYDRSAPSSENKSNSGSSSSSGAGSRHADGKDTDAKGTTQSGSGTSGYQ